MVALSVGIPAASRLGPSSDACTRPGWCHRDLGSQVCIAQGDKGDDTFVWAELDPYYRLSIGNVFTQAAGGAVVRVGYNVQRSWTQKIPETKRRGSSLAERKWELHGFAGTEARLVGWNALLQHDTYTPRPLPPIKRVVQDFEAGVAVGRGRLSGGFRWVWRTPEYEGGRRSAYAGPYVALQR
jgi:hypothetical protein